MSFLGSWFGCGLFLFFCTSRIGKLLIFLKCMKMRGSDGYYNSVLSPDLTKK